MSATQHLRDVAPALPGVEEQRERESLARAKRPATLELGDLCVRPGMIGAEPIRLQAGERIVVRDRRSRWRMSSPSTDTASGLPFQAARRRFPRQCAAQPPGEARGRAGARVQLEWVSAPRGRIATTARDWQNPPSGSIRWRQPRASRQSHARGGRGRRDDRERRLIGSHELNGAGKTRQRYGALPWSAEIPTDLRRADPGIR